VTPAEALTRRDTPSLAYLMALRGITPRQVAAVLTLLAEEPKTTLALQEAVIGPQPRGDQRFHPARMWRIDAADLLDLLYALEDQGLVAKPPRGQWALQ
jgi:hypothetical protein